MRAKIRKAISTALYGETLPQELSMEERCALWPAASDLGPEHLRNCRVVSNREALLDLMPPGAVCAEVGVWLALYSVEILRRTRPKKLHLIDIDQRWLDGAAGQFPAEVGAGQVVLHHGDSSTTLRSMPKGYFDWIYIDGDHTYEGCKKDAEAALECLKPDGLLAFNDYTFFGPSDFCRYGVMEAVNEFCLVHDFEFVFLALQGRGYHDVVVRRIGIS